MKIFEYAIGNEFRLMPEGACILSAGVQDGQLVVWAQVDPTAKKVGRRFHVVPMGGDYPEGAVFINTVFMGPLVFHVFYE